METRFTWDPAKARKNLRVRGIIIGMTRGMVLLLVVFVDRTGPGSFGKDEIETIHLISARKAEKYETQIYIAAQGEN